MRDRKSLIGLQEQNWLETQGERPSWAHLGYFAEGRFERDLWRFAGGCLLGSPFLYLFLLLVFPGTEEIALTFALAVAFLLTLTVLSSVEKPSFRSPEGTLEIRRESPPEYRGFFLHRMELEPVTTHVAFTLWVRQFGDWSRPSLRIESWDGDCVVEKEAQYQFPPLPSGILSNLTGRGERIWAIRTVFPRSLLPEEDWTFRMLVDGGEGPALDTRLTFTLETASRRERSAYPSVRPGPTTLRFPTRRKKRSRTQEALPAESGTEGNCQVCGDPLGGEVVVCSVCETPHHPECWKYNQGCSTFGCGN